MVNAFALECNRRQRYVVIHAEIAMLMPTAPEIVEFVLAHELAHHKLRHVSLWRLAIGVVPQSLVLPGLATTRAQEYSAARGVPELRQHGAAAGRRPLDAARRESAGLAGAV